MHGKTWQDKPQKVISDDPWMMGLYIFHFINKNVSASSIFSKIARKKGARVTVLKIYPTHCTVTVFNSTVLYT